jgi:hypothetical protein
LAGRFDNPSARVSYIPQSGTKNLASGFFFTSAAGKRVPAYRLGENKANKQKTFEDIFFVGFFNIAIGGFEAFLF